MELKFNTLVQLFLLGVIMLISCNDKTKEDTGKLCTEFYLLNKGKNFDGLFDVIIGDGRVQSIYDENLNKYDLVFKTIGIYDIDRMEYVTIPVFNRGASRSTIDSTFKSCSQQAKDFLSIKLDVTSRDKLFYSYVDYVGGILKKYYEIETPNWYSSKSVIIEGNPNLGKFITFTLNNKCACYFLENPNSLSPYWSHYFKKLNKLDSNWFYEVKNMQ